MVAQAGKTAWRPIRPLWPSSPRKPSRASPLGACRRPGRRVRTPTCCSAASASASRRVGRGVVGEQLRLRMRATAVLADGHALLEDVPGVGKTLLARAFSQALGLTFARVQGTPDLLPTDVTGSSILDHGDFRFVPGPVFTNVLLVDEINRATPRTQSSLLEAMQERQVSAEGVT